ncbi:trypsin-like serine protease [Sorangium sp. So ce1335]|uniref:trypsin-like serine protease n=1 Tax=Sorangium sp. So ce1335 TaxID=3133335 RepID=UPI003F632074
MTNSEMSNNGREPRGAGFAWNRTGALGALLALATAACGAADPSDDFSDEPLATDAQEIRFGTHGGGVGAVMFGDGGCTGTLVGTHMILTAAHCWDGALGSALQGTVSTRVSYAQTGTTFRCLTGTPATDKCNVDRDVYVQRLQVGADAKYDLAVVTPATPGAGFHHVTAFDTADGIYSGPLSQTQTYRMYGAGFDDPSGSGNGIMRYMDKSLNWVGERHFVEDTEWTRVCHGDSGGPYFLRDSSGPTRWMFGLHSNSDKASGEKCAEEGGKTRGMRFTETRIGHVNEYRANRALPACTRHSSAFPDYWVCY